MNSTAYSATQSTGYTGPASRHRTDRSDGPKLVIQILSVIAFGVFSIVAVSLAFTAFWVAGLIATVMIAWTWAGSRMFGGRRGKHDIALRQAVGDLAPPVFDRASSGNSSFDAYRAEVLDRLEQESEDFDAFVMRLRAARDASEFDQFLEDRARTAKEARAQIEETETV